MKGVRTKMTQETTQLQISNPGLSCPVAAAARKWLWAQKPGSPSRSLRTQSKVVAKLEGGSGTKTKEPRKLADDDKLPRGHEENEGHALTQRRKQWLGVGSPGYTRK